MPRTSTPPEPRIWKLSGQPRSRKKASTSATGQQQFAVATESQYVGSAFRIGQYSQSPTCFRVVQDDLLVTRNRDDRRPGAGGDRRGGSRSFRIHDRLFQQSGGNRGGTLWLAGSTGRGHGHRICFLHDDLRTRVFQSPAFDPLLDDGQLGIRNSVLIRRHLRFFRVTDECPQP